MGRGKEGERGGPGVATKRAQGEEKGQVTKMAALDREEPLGEGQPRP